MKITFPHLGPVYLIINLTLKELGLDTVIPSINQPSVLEAGKKLSPEEMCLPFKYMMGNLIEAHEKGAARVIMPATIGPCRLGEYGELLKSILDRNGYAFQWYLLDTPKSIGMREFLRRVKESTEEKKVGNLQALLILQKGVRLMYQLDNLEAKIKDAAGYAKYPGDCVKLVRLVRQKLRQTENLKQAFQVLQEMNELLDVLPKKENAAPIRILLTGEIYTLIESAANQQIEEKLMMAGCSVKREVTVSWWIKRSLLEGMPFVSNKGTEYMPYSIGGFAKETISGILKAPSQGYDGVIKIMPSGCMPEIVAKAVCGRISEEQGIKILDLIFDEMSGSAGYETRLEAFVDMLERSR